jgi:hypothetical protein
MGGKNIQSFINELKQKMSNPNLRSKSHEKAQNQNTAGENKG